MEDREVVPSEETETGASQVLRIRNFDPTRRYKGTVDAVVLIDRVFYDDGYRSAYRGETVKLTEEDAVVLSDAGQVQLTAAPAK